ncbi:hypothetical protein EDC65_0513 [Stella humosa]|uniref:DUF1453 domain-containing protein n=1 Tax=Stella humosa TaxID=94 RepID=A0A3N1MDY5_9PROT|nr:DUF6622 family protein [Stella humosa]ROQ01335.1 hypothetical protein EDC65_0513 [Stella humosa]BBK31709.1 hypothetical protein STHU_23430 [Stella humosa]
MEMLLTIVARTPPWVWVVLVIVLVIGFRGLRPQRSSPRRLLITPAVFVAIALVQLVISANPLAALPAWLAGMVPGAVIGWVWARGLPFRIDRAAGRIETPGTAFWLVVGMLLFACRYALGVYVGMHPELRTDPFWVAAPFLVAGVGSGMALAWAALLLRRYFRDS